MESGCPHCCRCISPKASRLCVASRSIATDVLLVVDEETRYEIAFNMPAAIFSTTGTVTEFPICL